MTFDLNEFLDIFFRWVHVASGILWIGLLYFFNFVNSNFASTMDGDTKKKVVPQLMPRALFFFRWSAMFTLLAGLVLLVLNYARNGEMIRTMMDLGNSRFQWISVGVLFGTIMWFNVWFIIWPAQKQIIPAVRDGKSGEGNIPALAKSAGNASKINTYLSFPMLFCMLSSRHFVTTKVAGPGIMLIALAFVVPWLLYKYAPKVKGMA